jgi:hypothetical protein
VNAFGVVRWMLSVVFFAGDEDTAASLRRYKFGNPGLSQRPYPAGRPTTG